MSLFSLLLGQRVNNSFRRIDLCKHTCISFCHSTNFLYIGVTNQLSKSKLC
ncbi:hypothetical protein Pint_28801 [Pistacia integerrima]|uniref:Uncharacterized protein n=1 Tax=Pistacia integerrima TaxID=434235 RepID=A0ACC0X437_9ROSI|nr:hypothetical protein Pint_28801 [Pistacia integerrima]